MELFTQCLKIKSINLSILHTYASIIYIKLSRQSHKPANSSGVKALGSCDVTPFFPYDVNVVILLSCLIKAFVFNRCIYILLI